MINVQYKSLNFRKSSLNQKNWEFKNILDMDMCFFSNSTLNEVSFCLPFLYAHSPFSGIFASGIPRTTKGYTRHSYPTILEFQI